MARGSNYALLLGLALTVRGVPAQEPKAAPASTAQSAQEPEPPEEDDSLKPKEYALNPIQATKEINAGNFYYKKGNTRAAAKRYLEATKWDPGSAEAFYKLGETSEKMHDYATALEAFTKYLELAKDAKNGDAIRKRIAKWPGGADSKTK